MHNILPFALNPQDTSWCGIAFPLGNRETVANITIKSIFIRKEPNTPHRDCILFARALQRTIYETCSSDNNELHERIFSSQHVVDATSPGGADSNSNVGVKKSKLLIEDTNAQNLSTTVAYNLESEEEQDEPPTEESTFPSISINIKELEHGPSEDSNVV